MFIPTYAVEKTVVLAIPTILDQGHQKFFAEFEKASFQDGDSLFSELENIATAHSYKIEFNAELDGMHGVYFIKEGDV